MRTFLFAACVATAMTAMTASACLLLVPIDDDVSASGAASDGSSLPTPSGLSDASVPDSENEGGSRITEIDAGDGAPSGEACPSPDVSLVAWFRFDETSGVLAKDCSQSKMTATAIGDPPKWAQGKIGGGVDFNGSASCFEVDPDLLAFEGQPFTVAAWVFPRRFTTPTNTGRFIVSRKTPLGWHFGTDNPERLELDLEFNDAGGKAEVFAESIPANQWTHFATVYVPNNRMIAYVNGTRGMSKTSNVPALFNGNPAGPLRIGCRSLTTNHFDGVVDELRVYNRALTDGEVAALPTK